MTKAMLGGISASSVPPLAQTPAARALSYLCLSISGIARRAITAAAAMLDPDAAPKPAHAQLVATASPPGIQPNHATAARNNAVPIPELPATAPISRNIGMADKSQLAANTNGASRTTLSATLTLRSRMKPRKAIDPIATPMGTRNPINNRMQARLPSEIASGPTVSSRGSVLRTADEVTRDANDQIQGHQGPGDRQHPPAGPHRDEAARRLPHLAGARLLNSPQIGLPGEHRHINQHEDLDGAFEVVGEPLRSDLLKYPGDDVIVVARDPGERQVGARHHVPGRDDLRRAGEGMVEHRATGHVDGHVHHHQEAGSQPDPKQKVDGHIHPLQQLLQKPHACSPSRLDQRQPTPCAG